MPININLKPRIINIQFPKNIYETNIIYPLIEPFSYARIYFDRNKMNLRYDVIEVQLTETEKRVYRDVLTGVKSLLFVKLSEIDSIDKILSYLERIYNLVLREYGIKLGENSYRKIFYYIFRDIYGYGKIEPLMRDPYIEDIECSGINVPIFVVHRIFGNLETNVILNEDEIKETIEKFALRSGRHISYAEPLLDATLPDGSRVNATYSKDITTKGPTFTIRKFREIPWTPTELIKLGTATPEIFAYLWIAVEYKRNIIIIGGTSSGKTTMLNAISMFIPPNSRIISIEDTREIKLYHKNWVPAVVRYSSDKSREISMFDLLKESFRQRPDYVIVGEVRGEEAYVMFQGMASGHAALSTMHAESTKALIERLTSPPINLPKSLVNLLDISILMQHDLGMGTNIRRIKEIDKIEDENEWDTEINWNPFEKRYEYYGFKLFEDISNEYGIPYEDLMKEFEIRRRLLLRLTYMNILDFDTFSKIINLYYLNKEYIINYYRLI